MSNETALTIVQDSAIMPVMDIQQAMLRRQAIIDFTKRVMVKEVDYGRVPGTTKDTLLKPGAEKLSTLFGLSSRFETMEKELDWTGHNHGGEPFFYFQYRCVLSRGNMPVGEGVGSCNSWEKKYRYRKGERVCPECGATAIIKGKQQYGGGWLCYRNKGGCGAKWLDGDPIIEKQEAGQVLNDNPADLVNTIDKMAQKRSLVAATLIAVNASEFFTQDVEDMDFGSVIEGEFTEAPRQAPRTHVSQKQAKSTTPANVDTSTGEIVGNGGNSDPRGATSPTAQAARAHLRPKAGDTGNGPDWRKIALSARSISQFSSAAHHLLQKHDSEQHLRRVLEEQPGFTYDPANNAELLKWLETH